MNIQFDWQVGTDDELEILARARRRRRRRRWWVWAGLAVAIALVAAGGYLIVRRRYETAERNLAFQIQSVIDLEARAYAQGDQDLFLEQQDGSERGWYAAQTARTSQGCAERTPLLPLETYAAEHSLSRYPCRPVLQAKIEKVNLQGNIARVEVLEGEEPVRRARFYRQTDLGWKHTTPRPEFWGVAIQLTYGELVFRYHRRDQPHIDPLVEHIASAFGRACATLGCDFEDPIEVNFAVDLFPDEAPVLGRTTLLLPSPWLSGLPANGEWDEAYLNELTYWMTYQVASRHLKAIAGNSPHPLQRVMVIEYAAWRATRNVTQAPIVGRLVQKYGEDGLTNVLRSLENMRTLNLLLVEWMNLSSSRQPTVYFETLLNIERDALLAGRKETFLFLQDDASAWWVSRQEDWFDQIRSGQPPEPLDPLKVQTVVVSSNLARVTLATSTALPGATTLHAYDETVLFRRRGGEWKHAPPTIAQTDKGSISTTRIATSWLPTSDPAAMLD